MTTLFYFNHNENDTYVVSYFAKKQIPEITMPDITNDIFRIKGDIRNAKSISAYEKVIIFVHTNRPERDWLPVVNKYHNVDVVLISSADISISVKHERFHICEHRTSELNNIRLNQFIDNIETPDWSLIKGEKIPEYLITAHLMLLACSKDTNIALSCRKNLKDFWAKLPIEMKDYDVPDSWENLPEPESREFHQLRNKLQIAIELSLGK